jgi:hypothetical protein
MIKVNIADGFYIIWLNLVDIPKLAGSLDSVSVKNNKGGAEQDEPLLAFPPLVLHMGWTESPPYFCAETVTDVAGQHAHSKIWKPPPHRLRPQGLRFQAHRGGRRLPPATLEFLQRSKLLVRSTTTYYPTPEVVELLEVPTPSSVMW